MLSSIFGSKNGSGEEASPSLFERYQIDHSKKYGEGGYGATYAARDAKTDEPLAVKIIDTRRMRGEAIRKECLILERLDHQNVIKVKGHGKGAKGSPQEHLYYIFMELADGGELFDQVIDRGANAMDEDLARSFFLQLLAGVMHCHAHGVAHRDLKLENVLLTKAGVVKVIDFGLSYVYEVDANGKADRKTPLKDVCGSKSYAAPEVLQPAKGYDGFAADVWSLGVSLFAMLSGFFPLDEATSKDWRYARLVEAQANGKSTTKVVYAWYRRSWSHLSVAVIDLLDGLLSLDPAKRLTVDEIVSHPWCKGAMGAAVDQGAYDPNAIVDMDMDTGGQGVVWRGSTMTEPDDGDFSEPVYRSIGADADLEPLGPVPMLGRQTAFGRDEGAVRIY